jgi:opacity protein-like surface antigen
MSNRSHHTVLVAILLAIGATPMLSQTSSANESNFVSISPQISSLKIAQTPAEEREEKLKRQRETERVLKEAERLKREVRDSGNPYLQQRVNEEVIKVRESNGNRRKLRESEQELNRLREQENRSRYDYRRFGNPSYTTPTIIVVPGSTTTEERVSPSSAPINRVNEYDEGYDRYNSRPRREPIEIFGSVGFRNGNTSPGIGVRYSNVGLELSAIFNQDSLPGNLNDFSLPSNSLFNNLGVKKVGPQWGADVLGFVDIAPRVSVYGSVGIYLQGLSQIVESQATGDFYKQTNETNVTGAVGGGLNFKPSENTSIGVGYHSLRGVTGGVGVRF